MSATTTDIPDMSATASRAHENHAPPAEAPRAARESGEGDRRAGASSVLLAPFRWLRRKLSDVLRWVKKRLGGPLRSIPKVRRATLRLLRSLAGRLPAPIRALVRIFAPREHRGFGNRWLIATLGLAVALGLVVALLATPVAALIAVPLAAGWSLVHWIRHRRDDDRAAGAPAPA